ncbi:LPS assembly lipoprotein LptE [Marinivivus vitaminiproducens]|uniref:LPS assembly lipoprotein LptE n=1 Tax=Marinivivus vitaminiproducens TaxID=3035935 RepID=UPI00279955FB|nr:LPS assembly lipoprotein LptE [Geminicoccaceae bacterium SCSIO 64248]
MASSRRNDTTRPGGIARRRLLATLGGGVLVAGCNIRPLYFSERDQADLRPEMAAIEVETPNTEIGQVLGSALRDELNPTAQVVPIRYTLAVGLDSSTEGLGILPDSTVTRYNYEMTARARLQEKAVEGDLFTTRIARTASYNLIRQPFATLISEQDAERRVAQEIAQELRTQVALFLRNRAAGAT